MGLDQNMRTRGKPKPLPYGMGGYAGPGRNVSMPMLSWFLVAAVRRAEQIRLFEAALGYIGADGDMVSRAIDVALDLNRVAIVTACDLP